MVKTAVIFCAGYGTRLKPLTDTCPKPLLPLPGGCCLERIIQALLNNNVQKILLNAHHLKKHIIAFSKKYPQLQVTQENDILETGGGVINMLPFLDENILLINGDIWTENMSQTVRDVIHRFKSLNLPNLLLQIPRPQALFYEKKGDFFQKEAHAHTTDVFKITRNLPPFEQMAPFVFGGIHLWRKKFILKNKPPETKFSMLHYFDLAEQYNELYGFVINQKWCDMGTPAAYNGLFNYLKGNN
jgi:MurNAc alpha-1-phosphate uridylyltransferase